MENLLEKLDQSGAIILQRHFVYTSGKHGPGYINLDVITPDVGFLSEICAELVEPFLDEVDTVVAPAVGGIPFAVLAGRAFQDARRNVAIAWADKAGNGEFVFERAGFVDQLRAKRVLVVEDLLNTGGSVEKVCRAAEREGANVVGVSVVCNRGVSTAQSLNVPRLEALAKVTFQAIAPAECPLCEEGVPIVDDISHGDKFKADNPNYKGGFVSLLR